MATPSVPTELPRKLDDGLILRTARRGDANELADFNATMHDDADVPGALIADWTLDLFEPEHPMFDAERDITVVEDPATGRIVSTLFLIPQVWTYAGVAMGVGQPELIATHPHYRRRGLIRTQFEVVHEWSRVAGHLWQFIGGIPWYYRQFGYTYAVDQRIPPVAWRGPKPPSAPPGYSLRPAVDADVPFLAGASAAGAQRAAGISCVRDVEAWRFELRRRRGSLMAREIHVIERAGHGPIGYVAHPPRLGRGFLSVRGFELVAGHSWLEASAAVIAHLQQWIVDHPDGFGSGVRLWLPDGHPARRSLRTQLGASPPRSYGLYIRVPDVVAYLDRIRPVLEARLAASPAFGWTGTFTINLYTEVVQLTFAEGVLTSIARVDGETASDISVPPDGFVHLLLGNRDLTEIEHDVADCQISTDAGALLSDVLLPRMPYDQWEFD